MFKQIEEYLNNNINKNKEFLAEEIYKVTGVNKELIQKQINLLKPSYIVTKDMLKLVLEMDMETLPIEDIRLIDFLLNEMGEKEKLYISDINEYYKNSKNKFIFNKAGNNVLSISYEQNIYQGSISCDLNYIAHILVTLGIKINLDNIEVTTNNINLPHIDHVYSILITNLAVIITANLKRKGIHIFDNKYISQTPETIEKSLEDYFLDFYKLFKDIISTLITDINKFIEIVGYQNFKEFIKKVNEDELSDIDEILQKMYQHKLNYQSGIYINVDLIEDSIKKYKRKEHQ